MLTSFNTNSMGIENDSTASTNSFNQSMNAKNTGQHFSDYAAEYMNAVKENRSLYGNFVDNSLAFDPYKEQKSVYNVVYETDGYNPWGKPGGGAPKLDQTGQLKTKIVGTLRWNLNGETEEDRAKRLMNTQKTNKNTLLYKKNSQSPNGSPRLGLPGVRESTTYNFNYRDHYNDPNRLIQPQPQQSFPIPQQQQLPQPQQLPLSNNFDNLTQIEREAHLRKIDRQQINQLKSSSWSNDTIIPRPMKTTFAELNRVSNKLYNDNQPTREYPNDPFWFGRTGAHRRFMDQSQSQQSAVQFQDVRRRKLLDALENRAQNNNNNQLINSSNQLQASSQFAMSSPERNNMYN